MSRLRSLFQRRNFLFLLLLVAEILLFAATFFRNYTSAKPVNITPDLIIPYVEECTNDSRGARVSNFDGVFATTRWFDIQPGSYQVSITYVTNGQDGSATFVDEIMPMAQYDPISLPASRTRTVVSLWMPYGCSTAQLLFTAHCADGQEMYITGAQLIPTHSFAYMHGICLLLFFVVLDWAVLIFTRRIGLPKPLRGLHSRYGCILLVGVVAFSLLPMGTNYLPFAHDMSVHLARIDGLKAALLDGQFPARMYPALLNDKGYPFGIMYADLFLYPAALLRLLGFPLDTSYKIYVAGITLATALVTRWVLRKMLNSESVALLGSALYTLSFYRLTNVYVRGAVGEYTAMLFLPLVVYGFWRIYTQPADAQRSQPWCWLPLALGFTGLLQSHLLTTEMTAVVCLIFCLCLLRHTLRRPVLTGLFKAAGAAVLWNLWFLVPLLDYMLNKVCLISDGGYDALALQDSSLFMGQMFMMFGQFGYNRSIQQGLVGEMPLSVGTVLGLGAALMLMVLMDGRLRRRNRPVMQLGCAALGLSALCLWLSSDLFPWFSLAHALPKLGNFLGTIQFAWRFLSPATVLLVVCTCCALCPIEQFRRPVAAGISAVLLVLTLLPAGALFYDACTKVSDQFEMPYQYQSIAAIDNKPDQISGSEYLPANAPDIVWEPIDPAPSEGVALEAFEKIGLNLTLTASNPTGAEGHITLPNFYYPGYAVRGTEGTTLFEDGGYLALHLPAGWSGSVSISFTGQWYWRISDLLSAIGIIATVLLWKRRKWSTIQNRQFSEKVMH